MNLGVFASHEGTTLQTLLNAFTIGRIPGRVAVVVSNNGDSGAMIKARQPGVQAVHLSTTTHEDPIELDTAIRDVLVAADVDVVFLAGFMKKLGPIVLETFKGRVLGDSRDDLKTRVRTREKEFVVETLALIASGEIRLVAG